MNIKINIAAFYKILQLLLTYTSLHFDVYNHCLYIIITCVLACNDGHSNFTACNFLSHLWVWAMDGSQLLQINKYLL